MKFPRNFSSSLEKKVWKIEVSLSKKPKGVGYHVIAVGLYATFMKKGKAEHCKMETRTHVLHVQISVWMTGSYTVCFLPLWQWL